MLQTKVSLWSSWMSLFCLIEFILSVFGHILSAYSHFPLSVSCLVVFALICLQSCRSSLWLLDFRLLLWWLLKLLWSCCCTCVQISPRIPGLQKFITTRTGSTRAQRTTSQRHLQRLCTCLTHRWAAFNVLSWLNIKSARRDEHRGTCESLALFPLCFFIQCSGGMMGFCLAP